MYMRQNQWQWWKLSSLSTECIYYQYRQFLLQGHIPANSLFLGRGQRGSRGGCGICDIILKLMYGGLPKGKKVLQRKEEERKMEGHWDRVKNARPNTTGWSFYDQYRVLNNGKKNMINEDKYTQIQRENRLLLEKITNTMNKRAQSVSEKQRQSRSLHGSYRKKQLTNIQIENARLLKRLQEKRSSYQADKMNSDWKKQKAVIRNIANYPLVIKDGSYRRERKRSFNKPLNLDFDRNAIKGDVEMMRIRNIDGITMVITVKLEEGQLTIMSDMKASKTVKIIEIPREEAMEFIELECEGKLENIFDRLRYDGEEEVLYLVSQGAGLDEVQAEEK